MRALIKLVACAATAYAFVLLVSVTTPKDAYAAPACLTGTLDNYLAAGFNCEFGFGAWQVSQISFAGGGTHPTIPRDEWANNILVTPFGGTERAGFQFDLLEPLNAVPADSSIFFQLEFTVQLLSGAGIQSAALYVPTIFAGPPNAHAGVTENACLGTLWTGTNFSECATGSKQLSLNSWGSEPHNESQSGNVLFDPVFLIDTLNYVSLEGGGDLPGGARIDSFSMAFNTNVVPEPTTLAIFGIGLAGLGFAWRRRAA